MKKFLLAHFGGKCRFAMFCRKTSDRVVTSNGDTDLYFQKICHHTKNMGWIFFLSAVSQSAKTMNSRGPNVDEAKKAHLSLVLAVDGYEQT